MRGSVRSTLAALTTCVLCIGASPPAVSNTALRPDRNGLAEARRHFDRGLTLYGNAEYGEARAEIERAYAIAPSYRLLYDLALCCSGQGDHVAAVGYLEQYLAEGGAEIEPARRAEADELLSHLRPRVASLTIRTNVIGDASVVVDDRPRGAVSGRPLLLLPGVRKIWVTKAGYYPASQVITLEGGDRIEVSFDLRELPRTAETRQPWWHDGRVRWPALATLLIFCVVLALARVRKKPARTASIVHLNPYHVDADATPPEPTPEHTNVIRVDHETSSPVDRTPLALTAGAATDIGLVKPSNEDSHLVDRERGLFVVADGIGGHAGGGVASRIAVETIATSFSGKPDVGLLTHLPRPA
ncbi:MAG TPA: hypothetical protein VM925_17235, partial [Labilithrix sp.]|nr:hypothetical protein [Labilithrix sp.]